MQLLWYILRYCKAAEGMEELKEATFLSPCEEVFG